MGKTKTPEPEAPRPEAKGADFNMPEVTPFAGNVTDNPTVQDFAGIARLAVNVGVGVPWDPNQTAVSAAGAAVSIALTPVNPNDFVEIGQVEYSYSAAPTGGGVAIYDGAVDAAHLVYQLDANSSTGAAQQVQFLQPRVAKVKGNTVVITLLSGGGTVVGKLNVEAWIRK